MNSKIKKITIKHMDQHVDQPLEEDLHNKVEDNLFDSVKLIQQAKRELVKNKPTKILNELSDKMDDLIALEQLLKNTVLKYIIKKHDLSKQSFVEKRNNEVAEMKKQIRRNLTYIHKIEDTQIRRSDTGFIERIFLFLLVFPGIPCCVGLSLLINTSLYQSLWIFAPLITVMGLLLIRIIKSDRKIKHKERIRKALDVSDKHLLKAIQERKTKTNQDVDFKDNYFKKNIHKLIDKEVNNLKNLK
jgi:hypothetical protein